MLSYCGAFAVSGSPSSLELLLEGCFCAETFTCTARVAPDGAVDLDVQICPSDIVCATCNGPGVTSCALPALPAGRHVLRQSGRDLGVLEVLDSPPPPEAWRDCVTAAPEVEGGLFCALPGRESSPDQICVEGRRHDRMAVVRVTESCGGCFERPGPCVVSALPGDTQVLVEPFVRSCDCPTCGDCAPVCIAQTVDCWIPPDVTGRVQIVVGGRVFGDVDLAAEGTVCSASTGGGGAGPGR